MRTVRDGDGNSYLLVARSEDASRVRDPETGEERYVPNEEWEVVGEDPLEVAARAVPEHVRRLFRAARTEAALGLVADLDARGPTAVRDLLAAYDRCESDLHGLLAELTVGGVVEECEVAGERGYRTTEEAADALAALRSLRD